MEPMNEQHAMSRVVSNLEIMWAEIANRHPEVPLAVVVVATGEGNRHGHFAKATWEMMGARVPEVLVAGESLAKGAEFILSVLIHEAAHGIGAAREVKNTSRQGRYHNTEFKKLALEIGMEYPADQKKGDPRFGWAFPSLPASVVDSYRDVVGPLQEAIDGFYRVLATKDESEDKEKSTCSAVCQCKETARGIKMVPGPRRITVSKSVLALGGIACEVCGALFEEEAK